MNIKLTNELHSNKTLSNLHNHMLRFKDCRAVKMTILYYKTNVLVVNGNLPVYNFRYNSTRIVNLGKYVIGG